MGFGDWLYEAGSSAVDGVVTGLTAVKDGAIEVGAQVAAPVVGGVTNGLQMMGADVKVEWAETRLDDQINVIAHVAAPVVGGVTNGLQMMGADVEVEWAETRLDTQLAVIEPATTWIADTAAPAVWNGGAYIVAVSPVGYVARGAEWAFDTDLPDWAGGGLADRNEKAQAWAEDMGTYVKENPGRATALATQGIINAASSTVGFVGDIGRNVLYEYTTRPLAVGIYNLGMEEDEKANLISDTKFFSWTTGLNDTLQVKHLFDEDSLLENKSLETAFDRVQPVIIDDDGNEIPNPYKTQEMTLMYGPQAVAEALMFWAVGSVTAGVGGAALAALRVSSVGTKVVQVMKSVDMLADAAKLIDKAAKAANKVAAAEEKLLQLEKAGASMSQIAKAEKALAKAQAKLVKAEGIANTAATAHATEAGKVATAAEQKLEALKAASASAEDIAKAEIALQQAQNAEKAAQELIKHTTGLSDKAAVAQAEEAIRQAAQLQAQESAKALTLAETQLAELKAAGASADDIANAQIAVEQATRVAKTSDEVLLTSTTRAAQASEQAAMPASAIKIEQIDQSFTTMQRITNGWDAGIYKAGSRALNPFFDTTAKVVELGGAGLAFGLGVSADLKNTAAEVDGNKAIRDANSTVNMDRYDNNKSGYSVDELMKTYRQMQDNKQSPDNTESGGAPLSGTFNQPAINKANGSTLSYASDGQGGVTSTAFNNRVDGTTTSLNPDKPTIFTLTFDTPEEAKIINDSLSSNK
ncbi:MAG: hypothetical protein ACRBB3_04850 [Alphaproteobacteria bacterium]